MSQSQSQSQSLVSASLQLQEGIWEDPVRAKEVGNEMMEIWGDMGPGNEVRKLEKGSDYLGGWSRLVQVLEDKENKREDIGKWEGSRTKIFLTKYQGSAAHDETALALHDLLRDAFGAAGIGHMVKGASTGPFESDGSILHPDGSYYPFSRIPPGPLTPQQQHSMQSVMTEVIYSTQNGPVRAKLFLAHPQVLLVILIIAPYQSTGADAVKIQQWTRNAQGIAEISTTPPYNELILDRQSGTSPGLHIPIFPFLDQAASPTGQIDLILSGPGIWRLVTEFYRLRMNERGL